MKKALLLILALGAAGAAWYFLGRKQAAAGKPEFATATVGRGDITQNVTASGQLEPLLSVDVGSQISGQIKKLYVDFNSAVAKGQKIAEIDPATYEQRARQAEADLASSEASNSLQRLNTERTKSLFERKLVTQQEHDQALAQLQQSDAQLLTRRAALENARVDLARCTIFSPVDGIVLSKQTEEGKTVAASLNSPTLFVIANDLAKMRIVAAVAEADIGQLEVGQDVSFTADAFPNRTFRGRVAQIRNFAKNQQNVITYETLIDVDNSDLKLRPGMTASVSITVARRAGALRVANAALRARIPDGVPVNRPEAKAPPAPAAAAPPAPASGETPAERPQRRERAEGGNRGEGGGRRGGGMFGQNLSPEQREKMREIMQQAGVDFRSGPPTPEQREQIRKLMAEAGLPVAPAGGGAGGETVAVTRTVYRLPGGAKSGTPDAVSVQVGVSDGINSEILSGLNEGDVLVTNVTLPGAQTQQPTNPFGGQRRF
jgi:HlyD family secretion protein